MADEEIAQYIKCPWCGEDDFDLPGLKHHISAGHCDAYDACKRIPTLLEAALSGATSEVK